MKIHPFLAAAALLLAGVMAFGATLVMEHRRARARRPPSEPEVEEPPPAPRQVARAAPTYRPRPAPAPAAVAANVVLRVHVTGPHGLLLEAVAVTARRRDDEDETETVLDEAEDDHGSFTAELAPARYDLEIEAHGMRDVRAEDAQARRGIIEIALERAPLLLGAVGNGSACANVKVTVFGSDGKPGGNIDLNADTCTFVADDLSEPGPLTVVATIGTRRESALVTLPVSGDPVFLCLAPPCVAAPASLFVYVSDTNRLEVDDATLTWTLQADELNGEMGTSMGTSRFFLHDRRPGQTLLQARSGDRTTETIAVVGSGVTEVVLVLPAEEVTTDVEASAEDDVTPKPRAAPRIRLDGVATGGPPSRGSAHERAPSPR
jgi:hypothetical protein